MRVILLRHGETAWTVTGQHTGKTDLELTEAGRAEAHAAGPVVERIRAGHPLDVVYSSPRKRALETASLAFGSRVVPTVTELIAEFDYGAYEGLTALEIQKQRPGWSLWEDGCLDGESMTHVEGRADRFVSLVRERHPSGTIAIVSHGHFLRILTARFLGLEGKQGRLFAIATASVSELIADGGAFVVSRWGLTA